MLPIDPGLTVSYEILQPSGYGYLKLTTQGGDSAAMANTYTAFRDAIILFNTNGSRGMILVGPREISSGEGIPMMLQKLPGNRVISFYGSNGSFGMMESWSYHYLYPQPDDLFFRFPVGRSMDQNGEIQLDSDSTMHGGVVPDIRVPINDTVIDQLYTDSIDVELNYAIGVLNSLLGINDQNPEAKGAILEQIAPNPVTSTATISYRLKEATTVTVSIIDLYGREVTILVDEPQKAGRHRMIWNVAEKDPGIYFCRIRTSEGIVTGKCIVL